MCRAFLLLIWFRIGTKRVPGVIISLKKINEVVEENSSLAGPIKPANLDVEESASKRVDQKASSPSNLTPETRRSRYNKKRNARFVLKPAVVAPPITLPDTKRIDHVEPQHPKVVESAEQAKVEQKRCACIQRLFNKEDFNQPTPQSYSRASQRSSSFSSPNRGSKYQTDKESGSEPDDHF